MSRIDKTTWRRIRLGEVGNTYGGLTGKSKGDFGQGKAKYITFLNVLNNTNIDTSQLEAVKVEVDENQNQVRRGDLFFNTSSETPEQVGMCAMLNDEAPFTFLNSFCFGYRLHDKTINPLYLVHYFNGEQGRKIMGILAQGATRYNLSKESFLKTELSIPDYHEQSNVVDAISALETEISNLHRLIAKQEAIKKSTLKLLLTPKPGWMLVRLGDVAEIMTGATPSTQHPEYWDGHIPWLSSGEVRQKYIYSTNKKITMEGLEAASTHMIPRHSIVMALAGQGSTRGLVAVNEIELCTNQSIASIIPHHSFNYLYLFHNLASRYDELREASSGDGGRGGITLPIIHNFEVVAPSLAEQKSIATRLSSLDCHAKELKAELAKAQNIKQGMMRYFFRD